MTSKRYWKRRQIKDLISSINKTEDFINKELSEIYKESLKDISNDIKKIYEKYATDNKLTLEQAKEKICKTDIRECGFKEIAKKIKGRITKLELMELQIQARLYLLYEKETANIYEYLYGTYKESYYKTMLNITKNIEDDISFNLPHDHDKAIHNAVSSNWSGKNFSKRIWKRNKETFAYMKKVIIKGLIRGVSIDKIVKDLQKRIDVSKSNAKRLVRTEANYAFNKGTLDGYKESGVVKRYMYLATFDSRTSYICKSLDGQIFDIKKAVTGTNCPPMHPNCRSTIVAYFDDYKYK